MTDLTLSQFASKDDLLAAQAARIAELEGSVTHLENVYGAAIRKVVELEQGKCLHQIAEPVTAGAAVRAFRDYLGVHDGIKLGGQAMDDMALDLARIALDFKHLVEPQHPDDAAVDALAALMKAKLAKQRAKGYGGWNDKTQCPQQRLSDMLRAHVDKGDPVDVANFCAMLSARGEGIAAAPQAVQAAVPEGWMLAPIKVPDSAFALVSGGYPAGYEAWDKRDKAIVHERAQRTWEAILNGITAPAPAAAPAPDERAAFEAWLGIKPCGAAHDLAWSSCKARAALSATQPAAQGIDGREFPPLTPELASILGLMCFQCISFAQALRAAGHTIKTRAEDEQAAVLHWMLGHYFRHGDDWRTAAAEDMKRMEAEALAAQAKQGGA